jgi:hypothetical protein
MGRRPLYAASAPSAFATYLRNDIRVRRSRLLCQRERLQLPQLPADPEAMTYLTTAEAATYLRYKTAAAVRQLKARGCIQPVGRRGKTDLYDRAALDAFVLGSAVERTDEHTHANDRNEGRGYSMASWIDGWKATRYPGIWVKGSSTRIRVRTTCPKTGKRVEANRVFEGLSLREAPAKQHELLTELLQESEEAQRTRFGSYATSLYKRKVAVGEIKSRKSMERWEDTLEHHLLPAFGDHFLDAITLRDLETFKAAVATKVRSGEYSPHTVNGWLSILRTVGTTAALEYQLERNPFALLKDIDTSEHRTYTEEQPNSLTDAELSKWLEWFATNEPQHYAFVFLGFMTGQRPSHLRPLRRRGPETDVLWDQGTLLIRRSETLGHVMNRTKHGKGSKDSVSSGSNERT